MQLATSAGAPKELLRKIDFVDIPTDVWPQGGKRLQKVFSRAQEWPRLTWKNIIDLNNIIYFDLFGNPLAVLEARVSK